MDDSPSNLVFLVESYSFEIKFTQVIEEIVVEKNCFLKEVMEKTKEYYLFDHASV